MKSVNRPIAFGLAAACAVSLIGVATAATAQAAPSGPLSGPVLRVGVPPAPAIAGGAEDRLAQLPQGASRAQVVQALYPHDAGAQQTILASWDGLSGWGTAWKATKCAAALGGFVAGNVALVSKLAKLGGVAKGARLIVQAGNTEERMELLVATFGEVLGLNMIASNCT